MVLWELRGFTLWKRAKGALLYKKVFGPFRECCCPPCEPVEPRKFVEESLADILEHAYTLKL